MQTAILIVVNKDDKRTAKLLERVETEFSEVEIKTIDFDPNSDSSPVIYFP